MLQELRLCLAKAIQYILALEIGEPHTADDARPQLWWSLLNAPSAGVRYRAHRIWSWEREAAVALNHIRLRVAQA